MGIEGARSNNDPDLAKILQAAIEVTHLGVKVLQSIKFPLRFGNGKTFA